MINHQPVDAIVAENTTLIRASGMQTTGARSVEQPAQHPLPRPRKPPSDEINYDVVYQSAKDRVRGDLVDPTRQSSDWFAADARRRRFWVDLAQQVESSELGERGAEDGGTNLGPWKPHAPNLSEGKIVFCPMDAELIRWLGPSPGESPNYSDWIQAPGLARVGGGEVTETSRSTGIDASRWRKRLQEAYVHAARERRFAKFLAFASFG